MSSDKQSVNFPTAQESKLCKPPPLHLLAPPLGLLPLAPAAAPPALASMAMVSRPSSSSSSSKMRESGSLLRAVGGGGIPEVDMAATEEVEDLGAAYPWRARFL